MMRCILCYTDDTPVRKCMRGKRVEGRRERGEERRGEGRREERPVFGSARESRSMLSGTREPSLTSAAGYTERELNL